MELIKLIIITSVLLAILLAAYSIKLFFKKNAQLPGGTCKNSHPNLKDKGLSCTCGGGSTSECKNKAS